MSDFNSFDHEYLPFDPEKHSMAAITLARCEGFRFVYEMAMDIKRCKGVVVVSKTFNIMYGLALTLENDDSLMLSDMIVIKDYTRNGIGRKMFQKLLDWNTTSHKVMVVKTEKDTIDFYRKLGFGNLTPPPEKHFVLWRMTMELPPAKPKAKRVRTSHSNTDDETVA